MNSSDFEKLGVFFLGRPVDPATGNRADAPYLLDAEDLTTHALCLGMTGSGKTGLGIGLLEEAAIDGIPALVVDPKGDLGNLLLQFPELRPADFRPWVDEDQARREGITPDQLATNTAAAWASGLAKWGQDGNRIRRLAAAADFAIYTPGSPAGLQLSIFSALNAPSPAIRQDPNTFRDSVSAAVASLLALANLSTDPQSPAFIFLSTLFTREWSKGVDLRLESLIGLVQNPELDYIGVLSLDAVISPKERQTLGKKLNALLASPSLAAWNQGEPLDIQRLLYTPDGRPRVSIISIAHLAEEERMFFTTLLLTSVVAWMRQQPGTSSLRALFYMDEIFGYFPPSSNPPSKAPMLTLLKQARAFGLGIVLATQNPVDLDYRGLSNIGLWMIGRLQTERDKKRLIDGLVGAEAVDGLDRVALGERLAALRKREFLIRNVHTSNLQLIESRFCLSYLRGPLALPEIERLMAPRKPAADGASPEAAGATLAPAHAAATAPVPAADAAPLLLPAGIRQQYYLQPLEQLALPPTGTPEAATPGVPLLPGAAQSPAAAPVYLPYILATARVHYADARKAIDFWRDTFHLIPVAEDGTPDWFGIRAVADEGLSDPAPAATYAFRPAPLTEQKTYDRIKSNFTRNRSLWAALPLASVPSLKLYARPDESDGDFRIRVAQTLRENLDAAKAKLADKHADKYAAIDEKIRKAEAKVETEEAQSSSVGASIVAGLGRALVSLLLGRKSSAITGGLSAITGRSRKSKKNLDIAHAKETLESLRQQRTDIETRCAAELADMAAKFDPTAHPQVPFTLTPKESDILNLQISLAWIPRA
ncbi:MAG: DUF87 domain-containing protein [Kiritimatiellae bacterium]|nr:DUF87 domain-containing protein [Kiritimatiellia bacterium]